MALINNNYVWVKSEDVSTSIESSSHPVEKGEPITDHVQKQPIELSISGKIVNQGKVKAADIVKKIEGLQKSGSLITYVGRNTISNLLIQDFQKSYVNTNWGGCDFSMTLKEVRIAKTAYVAKTTNKKATNTGTQQVKKSTTQKKVYHKVKKGDCVWNLVTKKYKTLYPKYSKTMDKCKWVMAQNPNAFSRKGDFGTLKIGYKLYIGYRK